MKILEYDVVNKHDLCELILLVNCKIVEGWQPFGGVQVAVPALEDGPAPLYAQAMVKYDDL